MLIRYVTLWPWLWPTDLDSSWYSKRYVIKVCTKFERNQAIPGWIIDNLANFAHVMSRCDLDLWPLDLEILRHFWCQAYINSAKNLSEIHGWVIDDLARFRVQFWGLGQNWQSFLRDAWTSDNHRSIALLFQNSDILLHFQTRAAQSWVKFRTTPNFAPLDTCEN